MDQLFETLVDAVETDEASDLKIITKPKFPDLYRPYLFNDADLIFPLEAGQEHIITNTKEIFWKMSINDLCQKLLEQILVYKSMEPHLLTNYLKNKTIPESHLKNYYDELYDIADIIIIKHEDTQKLIVKALQLLLANTSASNHVIFRMLMYLSAYYIKYSCRTYTPSMNKYIPVMITKIEEFKNEPNIWKYFIRSELYKYSSFVNKCYKKHKQLQKNSNK